MADHSGEKIVVPLALRSRIAVALRDKIQRMNYRCHRISVSPTHAQCPYARLLPIL